MIGLLAFITRRPLEEWHISHNSHVVLNLSHAFVYDVSEAALRWLRCSATTANPLSVQRISRNP
jgi:hypothetical protein